MGRSVCSRLCGFAYLSSISIIVLTGCTQPSDDEGDGNINVDATKNRSEWALPLNSHIDKLTHARGKREYATGVLVDKCLGEHEIPYPNPKLGDHYLGEAYANDPTINSVGYLLFNVDIAERYGYGGAEPQKGQHRAELDEMRRHSEATEQGAGKKALQECLAEAQDVLPGNSGLYLPEDLGVAAQEKAREEGDVKNAVEAWRQCMEPAGIPDLPAWPEEMPFFDGARERFNKPPRQSDEFVAWQPPTPEEIELAVMDAECRERSGFAQTYYNAQWDTEVELMTQNVDELDRVLQAIGEYEQEIDQILADIR